MRACSSSCFVQKKFHSSGLENSNEAKAKAKKVTCSRSNCSTRLCASLTLWAPPCTSDGRSPVRPLLDECSMLAFMQAVPKRDRTLNSAFTHSMLCMTLSSDGKFLYNSQEGPWNFSGRESKKILFHSSVQINHGFDVRMHLAVVIESLTYEAQSERCPACIQTLFDQLGRLRLRLLYSIQRQKRKKRSS